MLDFGVISSKTWRPVYLGAKQVMLREGAVWGNMRLPIVCNNLVSGALIGLVMLVNLGRVPIHGSLAARYARGKTGRALASS